MHIVSLFPSLFDYQLFGPLILRVALGMYLGLIGFDVVKASRKKVEGAKSADSTQSSEAAPIPTPKSPSNNVSMGVYGYICFVIGILLVIGLFTQAAALAVIILFLTNFIFSSRLLAASDTSTDAYILLIIISLALMLLGPGTPAVDLPL